jgi:hypothetical protein
MGPARFRSGCFPSGSGRRLGRQSFDPSTRRASRARRDASRAGTAMATIPTSPIGELGRWVRCAVAHHNPPGSEQLSGPRAARWSGDCGSQGRREANQCRRRIARPSRRRWSSGWRDQRGRQLVTHRRGRRARDTRWTFGVPSSAKALRAATHPPSVDGTAHTTQTTGTRYRVR